LPDAFERWSGDRVDRAGGGGVAAGAVATRSLHALARRGIAVPGEVAVTGFDDGSVARHLHPPLTTVRQPIRELGATAFDVLYSRVSAGGGDPDAVLPVRLVVRESCGCGSA